jgi:cytosine/adenosine deaminase-related metal-dependent hydrolase
VEQSVFIHHAPWVFPVSREPLKDGAVAVSGSTICAVAPFSELQQIFPSARQRYYPGQVLLPGLVNAHTHLELSHLAHLSRKAAPVSFTGWIDQMLAERENKAFAGVVVEQAAKEALAQQQQDGVIAVADITNTGISRTFSADFCGYLFCFKEFYGMNASGVVPTLQALAAENNNLCTAHAPYSTHVDILQAIKSRATRLGHIFPIHVAESASEAAMMSQGRGEIPQFLSRRGFWDNSFQPTGIDNSGSVQYLHQLGLLDNKTLCVHGVHVTDSECTMLQNSGSAVCLCPGSNRYLRVGTPPLAKYLDLQIPLALGTDSLTSNPEICLWREMRLVQEDHPWMNPADILAMATLGGSKALGIDHVAGSLDNGKRALFIAVTLCGAENTSLDDVMTQLVSFSARPEVRIIGKTADTPLTGRVD